MQEQNIKFHEICDEVIDVIGHDSFVEVCTEKSRHIVSQAALCIGHQSSIKKESQTLEDFIDFEILEEIDSNKTVAIQGMGLTACDVISRLTEGRGGRYEKISNDKLKYIPSKKEPKFYLFSRSGLFLSGRSFNQDHNYIYTPTYFTNENIEALRHAKGQLDFDKDLLPLLKQELQHAYSNMVRGGLLNIE